MNKEIVNIEYKEKNIFRNPVLYLRLQNEKDNPLEIYEGVKETLNSAFDKNKKNSIINQLSKKFKLPKNLHTQLDFINYGNTQLVYLATLSNPDFNKQFTVLINQPSTKLEIIKEEFENLQNIFKTDRRFVVEPHAFFSNGKHSLYATTYVENARCIYGGYPKWGMFDPKPNYHFIPFTEEISNNVSSSMIALLVRYYDEEQNKGISKTQLNGDDFILNQDWNQNDPNTILENMKLISARGTIKVTLNEYLNILRSEFMIGTHYNDYLIRSGQVKINFKSGLPISEKIIESGISLGLILRKKDQ